MALTVGTRLGPYSITAPLGAGGMGEVYRARDTKLDRDVAIKVLSDQFAHDPERLARFAREAKTLAALNHPNIAIVYGFEEADGIKALVMELVEGPTRILGGGVDNGQGRQYDVTRDGRFLTNTVLDEASAPITLLQNWHPEAKK